MPHLGLETSLLVGAAALLASTLAAITGLGGAAVLLPVLVVAFGVHDAVPILTVRTPLRAFVLIGAGASFLSALLGSVGPLMAPFFLAYGLVKGAYIGTEALSTVVMHVTKLVAYRGAAMLLLGRTRRRSCPSASSWRSHCTWTTIKHSCPSSCSAHSVPRPCHFIGCRSTPVHTVTLRSLPR